MTVLAIVKFMAPYLGLRRGVALRWPLVCIVSTSTSAALCNVVVTITGGRDGGAVGAGIRLATEALPQQSMHAAALVALSLLLFWTLCRTHRQRSLN